jgi:hypothetical protein
VRTYPSGYLPDKEADMLGLKVYRNADTGVFFHITRNVLVKGGLLADNRVGIDVDRADDIRIRNTEIIGRSNVYEKLATDTGSGISVPRFCTLESKAIGLQLHTWKDNPEEDGVTVMNVGFSGFANSICPEDTVPVSMDDTVSHRNDLLRMLTVSLCPLIVFLFLLSTDQDRRFRPVFHVPGHHIREEG